MLDVEEALRLILDRAATARRVPSERVALPDALGRVLREPVLAPFDSPPFDTSSRDGYALRASDLARTLPVAFSCPAGATPERALVPGEVAAIATGGQVPGGAELVVMSEDCEAADGMITLRDPGAHAAGDWIRPRASFMARGDVALAAGARLGAGELGLLASFNAVSVVASARPRVAIVTSGDELVDLGQAPGPSQIVNSNAHLVAALARAHGAEPIILPTAPDDLGRVRAAFEDALGAADLVLSVGGVSIGARDFARAAIEELCDGVDLWRVKMRPGKPLTFASRDGVPLIGLPGNPASSFVCFHQFVRPALDVLQGAAPAPLARLRAPLTADVASTPKRRHYVLGRVVHRDGAPAFAPTPNQDSGNPLLLAGASALAILEVGVASASAGDVVDVELL
jgi:molybdopterin molybdotransferase